MIDINQELSQNFLDFSYEANSQRAFADARDGLKPGQRACLWEMYSKGYTSNKPHVKCAKISGGTVASWWPHGTTAIYDTFARMSQTWINNIPEVDWHGANGSIQISGEPAADRYTEARLSKSTEDGLFQSIKKNNVPMKLNFSEDNEWPEVLPAIYPRLMVNGCQGIGSTIANVWLPNSLDEIAENIINYLSTGEIDYSKLAPSFPTGGIIINQKDMANIYKTGKGRVILRGKAEIKGDCIYITEMPYQVYVEPFIESVKQLILKDEITGITNILNKSNKKSLMIEIECDSDPQRVLKQLYAKTELQKNYNANQYALVGKTPKFLTYKEYLDIYLKHNYECIKREYAFDLEKSKKRLEIVEGLVKALEDIDNIIILIKQSESSSKAVSNLIATYQFTENQAKAIVDMRLGKLAHLEKIELNKEKEDLISTIADCENVISNNNRQKDIYLERFKAFVKKYPNPRRTKLIQLDEPKEEKEIVNVIPEEVVITLTADGTIKRNAAKNYKIQKRNTKGTKLADVVQSVIRTNTIDHLLVFTDKGRMYSILVDKIPEGKGTVLSALIEFQANEKPILIHNLAAGNEAKYICFATKQGMIKKTALSEYSSTNKKGVAAIKLKENDSLVSVFLTNDEDIAVLTHQGMGIHFKSKEVAATGRATMGVKSITLKKDDEVVFAAPAFGNALAIFTENGLGKRVAMEELPIQSRAGKGVAVAKDAIATGCFVNEKDNVLVIGSNSNISIAVKELPKLSRTASGNIMIKNNRIIKVVKL